MGLDFSGVDFKADIIIVEDSRESLKMLAKIFHGQNYSVRQAESCKSALELIHDKLPDLIVLDILMPNMNGYDFCRKLKSEKKTSSIPIIFCSAIDDEKARIDGFNAGGSDYIIKPFSTVEVLSRVKIHLEMKRALSELDLHKKNLEALVKERTLHIEKRSDELTRKITEHRVAEIIRKRVENITMARFRILHRSIVHSWSDIIRIVLDEAESLTGSGMGFFHIIKSDQKTISLQGWSSKTINEFCRSEKNQAHNSLNNAGLWAECVRRRQAVIFNCYESIENKKGVTADHPPLKNFITAPVFRDDKLVAVAGIGNKETAYEDHDAETLTILSELCWDIIERKQAEENLNKTFQRLTAHIDNSPLAVIEFDPEMRITRWSKEAKRIFGWELDEVFGKTISDFKFIYSDDIENIKNVSAEFLKSGKKRTISVNRNYKKDGGTVYCEWYNSGIYNESGDLVSILSLVLDITERRKAEEQKNTAEKELLIAKNAAEKANKVKSQFLANMSHDIRTPINGIKGFSNMLFETGISDEQREYLNYIVKSCDNLTKIINDILDISKIESGNLNIENAEFNIKNALDECIADIKFDALTKGIGVKFFIDALMPLNVKGDCGKLKQVLGNLLYNALKFTDKGEIKLSAETVSNDEKTVNIKFSVADTGTGIPGNRICDLFKPFTQLDMSVEKKYAGTGLGLSIVKNLTELMGGSVSVKSALGEGSVFSVEIPFTACDSTASSSISKAFKIPVKPASIEKIKILIVEDDELCAILAKKITEKLGHISDLAVNGNKAIEMLNAADYDMIILDIQLPALSGIDVARAVREKEKKSGRRIPIIVTTAFASGEEREKIMNCGIDEYIAKPIDSAALTGAINRLIEKRREPSTR